MATTRRRGRMRREHEILLGGSPPEKFLDAAQSVVSPEWQEWFREATIVVARSQGFDPATFYPEEFGKGIPPEGAWIRVVDVPHTNLGWDVPVLSMWRARPYETNFGSIALTTTQRSRPVRQAVIATPAGDLHLWPHEYVLVDDIAYFVGKEPDVEMHHLGGEPVLREDDDALFYVMSRGISRHDAALLLLDRVVGQGFVYFTVHPDLVAALEGELSLFRAMNRPEPTWPWLLDDGLVVG